MPDLYVGKIRLDRQDFDAAAVLFQEESFWTGSAAGDLAKVHGLRIDVDLFLHENVHGHLNGGKTWMIRGDLENLLRPSAKRVRLQFHLDLVPASRLHGSDVGRKQRSCLSSRDTGDVQRGV